LDHKAEWLEADGRGGFASGTVGGTRTRRYHALLLAATTPPTGRFVLVNGCDVWVETPSGRTALSSQLYTPGITHPDGARRIEAFAPDPWPQWIFRLEDGTHIAQAIVVAHGAPTVVVCWRLLEPRPGVTIAVRPFLSGRDYHALHHENPDFRFDATVDGERVRWCPYPGVPAVIALSNGAYHHEPDWFRNFLYAEERARGLDALEDLASPGIFRWDLSQGEAVWILAAEGTDTAWPPTRPAATLAKQVHDGERERRRFMSRLHRAADAYLVRRDAGETIVAGYPWFTDWGRDTFIALRGLCLATGRLDDARSILLQWAGTVSEGMLPNRFPDAGGTPEFNAVDASLWFIIAVHDFLQAMEAQGRVLATADLAVLQAAIEAILAGYAAGTRYGIRMDDDGLLAAGAPGVQLTWMDAKVGEWVVTPRTGKPVEVQALWLNALRIGSTFAERWAQPYERGCAAFRERFWNVAGGYLYDVVDVDHQRGKVDALFRPNQIFAVGGLPVALLDGARARQVVDAVEARLLTPLGLRSLAPDESGYTPRYVGGARERDAAYHQGTVWPWLIGAFVEAWVRVRGATPAVKREARARFLDPLLQHLDDAGIGHLAEIADGDPPHTPRGCPFQAWSVGEALRLDASVLAVDSAAAPRVRRRKAPS
jgi:predicted glycogen debranching enzyme